MFTFSGSGPRLPHKQLGFWGQIIGAVIGAGVSLYGGKKAQSAADKESARRLELEERQLAISEAEEGRASELFDFYGEVYQPIERELGRSVLEDKYRPDVEAGLAIADVERSAELQRGIDERRLQRVGVDPSSGRYVGSERARGLREVLGKAGAGTEARYATRRRNEARLAQVAGLGKGLPGQSAMFSGQAGRGLGDVRRGVAANERYLQGIAGGYGEQFGGYAADIGTGLSDWWKSRKKKTEPATEGG